eukprot:scaffold6596_cov140-Skeletonema_marinoi.AAC.1
MEASAATIISPPRRLTIKKRAALVLLLASILGFATFQNYYNSISLVDDSLSQRQLSSSWIERHPERGVSAGLETISAHYHQHPMRRKLLPPSVSRTNDKELIAFKPYGQRGGTYVNVDMTTRSGMLRAAKMGLVASGKADMLFAMDPSFAGEHLYDKHHKGRILGLFRHPVDRLASKFYYLQKADWEKSYRPEWADMSILEWAEKHNKESNVMVKKLAGVKFHDTATEAALRVAMRTLEKRFVVGLTDNMKESIRRFNIVMNIDG